MLASYIYMSRHEKVVNGKRERGNLLTAAVLKGFLLPFLDWTFTFGHDMHVISEEERDRLLMIGTRRLVRSRYSLGETSENRII